MTITTESILRTYYTQRMMNKGLISCSVITVVKEYANLGIESDLWTEFSFHLSDLLYVRKNKDEVGNDQEGTSVIMLKSDVSEWILDMDYYELMTLWSNFK